MRCLSTSAQSRSTFFVQSCIPWASYGIGYSQLGYGNYHLDVVLLELPSPYGKGYFVQLTGGL